MEALNIETQESAFDVIDFILESHNDHFVEPNIKKIILSWRVSGYDLADALNCLNCVANDSVNNLEIFLQNNYCFENAHKTLYKVLINLCKYANGEIDDDCAMLEQCKVISDKSPDLIKKHIGIFFRNKMNEFLQQNYPSEYGAIAPSSCIEAASCAAVANDNYLAKTI